MKQLKAPLALPCLAITASLANLPCPGPFMTRWAMRMRWKS